MLRSPRGGGQQEFQVNTCPQERGRAQQAELLQPPPALCVAFVSALSEHKALLRSSSPQRPAGALLLSTSYNQGIIPAGKAL